MPQSRTERDSFGAIEVPADRLWGAQTQRSLHHFNISSERMPDELISALARIKRASALVNKDLGLLDPAHAAAIVEAADEVLAGKHPLEFPLSVWQTGSGTQTNMNLNEVLANRGSELLGGVRGQGRLLHANDDVNLGQSSNDIFPTAMHVAAAIGIADRLLPALRQLRCRKRVSMGSNGRTSRTNQSSIGCSAIPPARPALMGRRLFAAFPCFAGPLLGLSPAVRIEDESSRKIPYDFILVPLRGRPGPKECHRNSRLFKSLTRTLFA